MAKLIWVKGNKGMWGYTQFQKYDVAASKSKPGNITEVRITYDSKANGASADHPPTALIEVENIKLTTKGNLKAGTLKSIKWLNAADKVILKTSGLNYDGSKLVGVNASLWYDKIFSDKTSFIGAKTSGGKDWDGDSIITTSGKDKVAGKGGDDWITDNGGKDTYDGGAGFDTVSYAYAKGSVTANLAKDTASTGGTTDKLISIEGIRGSQKKDKLIGDKADNKFSGLKGADIINGGGGTDDEARYHRDAQYGGKQGIVANMAKGTVKDGFGTIDKIKNIERIRGTDKADKFIDNKGRDGYLGQDGNDTFIFRGGNDWAFGGDGADKFIFQGKFGWDWIGDFDAAEGDRLKIVGAKFADLTIGGSSDGDATISYNGNTVELDGVNKDDVDASWFL